MTLIFLLNIVLAALAILIPNDVLAMNSFWLFGIQAVTILPPVLRRLKYAKNAFQPSVFVLVYFVVNFTLGSFLVPREYGWNKEFAAIAYGNHYHVIIPYFLLCNLVVFFVTIRSLRLSAADDEKWKLRIQTERMPRSGGELLQMAGFFIIFLCISAFDVYSSFSFEISLIIIHVTLLNLKRDKSRYFAYIYYLAVMTTFQAENKREIIMALFLICLIETYFSQMKFAFRPKMLLASIFGVVAFFYLIAAASIIRGYGGFPVSGLFDAIYYVPAYVASDLFIDGITDNFELNYNYGVAVTSIDLLLDGRIDYQYGMSFVKLLFLPIPREILPWKPDSVLQIFTKEYAPAWWAIGGSMPVMFASEMFINFNYLALLPIALTLRFLDWLFRFWNNNDKLSFGAMSAVFLVVTTLMLARGSGVEQYVVYYAVGAVLLGLWATVITNRNPAELTRQKVTP